MPKWVREKIPLWYLIAAMATALLGVTVLEQSKVTEKYPAFDRQWEAAQLMRASLQAVKELRQEQGIPVTRELDPNETGLIGVEYSALTTTLGKLDAKRTATNPDFAALMVRYFTEIGLEKGDIVAIGASGSFPALIIATLSAVKVMELRPLLIYSLGASMYGANIPELTFVRMLDELRRRGLLPYTLTAISLGGENDRAEGMMLDASQEMLQTIARQAGVPLIYGPSVAESVRERLALYQSRAGDQPVSCFVNIGGATANFGNTSASLGFGNGLVLHPPAVPDDPERGLLFEYALQSIPLIHLLNINDLALKNGIPVDPVPLPPSGKSMVYYQTHYYKSVIIVTLIVMMSLLIIPFLCQKRKSRN